MIRSPLVLIFFTCLSFYQLNAGVTGYLKIGDIKGESQAVDHEEEIDIHAIDWAILRPLSTGVTGSTRTRASAEFKDLIVTKRIDKSTPMLMEACASGRAFPDLVLSLSKDFAGASLDYLVITMKNVSVTSVNINGTAPQEDQPSVNVGFTYEEIEVVYRVFDDSGALVGVVDMAWDIESDTP